MTKEEFALIVVVLKAAYKNAQFLSTDRDIEVWFEMLKDLDGQMVGLAAKKHIATSVYPPTIAELRKSTVPSLVSDQDWLSGWATTVRAIRKFGYMQSEEALDWLEKEDPVASRIARRIGFEYLCLSENQMQDRANFRMAYEAEQSREVERRQLPESIRQGLEENQQRLLAITGNLYKDINERK